MQYSDLVSDFADRTKHNLELLRQRQQAGDEAFEVTQLVNSMLGLIVFPEQAMLEAIPETPMADLRRAGWPEIEVVVALPQGENLRGLARLLRNGIAHCNLRFEERDGVISGLRIWNHCQGKRNKPKNWEVRLQIEQLEAIASKFIDLLTK